MEYKYAIVGSGAIGGYYGGKLAKAGKDVHFLFHSDYEYVKKHGLQIDSIDGDFHLASVNAYNNTNDMPQCDVVLVCLKTTNNKLLKDILPPLLHKDTLVILIQNGLGIEEDLQHDFPNLNIAGGLAFIGSNKVGKGHIVHLDYGKINIGGYHLDSNSNIIEDVCNDFRNAGIEANAVDLDNARWQKLVWNIPFNGLCVVLNTTTNKLMENEYTVNLAYDIMLEVIHTANKAKHNIPISFAEEMIEMTKNMTPYSPSMKLDYDNKRPLEIEYIYTRPLAKALEIECTLPKVKMLEEQLHFIANNMK